MITAAAIIAVVKDLLIYATVIAAAVIIPMHLGGWGKIFAAIPAAKLTLPVPGPNTLGSYGAYATLALGSALALFLYPHSMTGILAASSGRVIRRNAALLPAYSFILGLLALLGFMAIGYGVGHAPQYAAGFHRYGPNFAVPALILAAFPPWFAGVAFAAIAIGALVPASIMSIATANIFTRDIYKVFLKPGATDVQLLGGIWIIQTLPAVMLGLLRWRLRPGALLLGWASGMAVGTAMAASTHFKSATFALHLPGAFIAPGYAALYALIVNLVVALVLSAIMNAMRSAEAATRDPAERFGF
jgi:SSS family solute:Na+ symporter